MLIVLFFYLAIVVILDQSVSLAHADNWNINVSTCREKQSLKHLPLCIAFYPTNQSVFTSLRLSSPIIIQSLFYEWKMEIKFVWDFGMRKSRWRKKYSSKLTDKAVMLLLIFKALFMIHWPPVCSYYIIYLSQWRNCIINFSIIQKEVLNNSMQFFSCPEPHTTIIFSTKTITAYSLH